MKQSRRVRWEACHCCGGAINRTDHMAAFCSPCLPITTNIKAAAHRAVRRAVLAGDLPPPRTLSCTDCGEPAKYYDHRDYSQLLLVEPVCHGCNIRRGPGRYPQPDRSAA